MGKFEIVCRQTALVSILVGEEGYLVKFGRHPRDFPRLHPEGNPKGLKPYFTIYTDSSPNTDIFPFLTTIY